eukprot:jgi/Orpsp1_1/1188043/evm.model.d7180000062076.1
MDYIEENDFNNYQEYNSDGSSTEYDENGKPLKENMTYEDYYSLRELEESKIQEKEPITMEKKELLKEIISRENENIRLLQEIYKNL